MYSQREMAIVEGMLTQVEEEAMARLTAENWAKAQELRTTQTVSAIPCYLLESVAMRKLLRWHRDTRHLSAAATGRARASKSLSDHRLSDSGNEESCGRAADDTPGKRNAASLSAEVCTLAAAIKGGATAVSGPIKGWRGASCLNCCDFAKRRC